MKSTEIIHDIVDEFGEDQKQRLNSALKALRIQVRREIFASLDNTMKLIKVKYNNGKGYDKRTGI